MTAGKKTFINAFQKKRNVLFDKLPLLLSFGMRSDSYWLHKLSVAYVEYPRATTAKAEKMTLHPH
jgi:hypothetical protein